MDSLNVTTNSSEVKCLNDVKEWVSKMGERGIYTSKSAQVRRSALTSFEEILQQDEPKSIGYVLEHVEDIGDRWGRKNGGNPSTVKTYQARVRGTLREFLQYEESPSDFKPRTRNTSGVKKQDKTPEPQHLVDGSRKRYSASYPLTEDNTFDYSLPRSGITSKEVYKVALHLITLANDFDPTNPQYVNMFSNVSR